MKRSIEVIKDMPDLKRQAELVLLLGKWFDEVAVYAPSLPADIDIYFDNWMLLDEQGVGGYAYDPKTVTISFDLEYQDKARQLAYLRETVFHEAFHLAQNYTGATGPFSGIESALYEGMATVFERDIAGAAPGYSDYDSVARDKLNEWRDGIVNISAEAFSANDGDIWRRWAFFDDESGERWRLYKVGVWLVDQYLSQTGKTATQLVTISPQDIVAELGIARRTES